MVFIVIMQIYNFTPALFILYLFFLRILRIKEENRWWLLYVKQDKQLKIFRKNDILMKCGTK